MTIEESLVGVRIDKLICIKIDTAFADTTVFINGDKKSEEVIPENTLNEAARSLTDEAIF